LVTYSGELWYREGLPSDVFRRLVVRKENETPLDRFSGDYEELMTYANFKDLADIIVGNEVLGERLTVLEPGGGVSLLERLHELEEMRRSFSSGKPASGEDAAKLEGYFEEFRKAIKGGKTPPRKRSQSSSVSPPVPTPTTEPEDETLDSIFDDDLTPPSDGSDQPGRLVVKVSADDLRKAAEDSEPEPEPEPEEEPEPEPEAEKRSEPEPEAEPEQEQEPEDEAEPEPEPEDDLEQGQEQEPVREEESESDVSGDASETTTSDVGAVTTPVTDVSTRPGPLDTEAKGPIEEAEEIERALRDEDHAVILKALHVEVTEIADGMLRRDPKHGNFVWDQAKRRGWYEANREEFELDPLERFYELAGAFIEAYTSEAKSSELKTILAEAGFSSLLLELREMFLNSRARF
jgi:hypothetical protein